MYVHELKIYMMYSRIKNYIYICKDIAINSQSAV